MLSSKEALECIIWRLSSLNDDLEPRETEKKEINTIKQDLERLEQLEIENRNNEKVVADGVKLMNRNLELQSRLEVLEKENKELLIKNNSLNIINTINQENIKNYLKEIVDYKNKCINQIQQNEKFKKAIIDILEYVKCELDSIEIVDRIENILNEVLDNESRID